MNQKLHEQKMHRSCVEYFMVTTFIYILGPLSPARAKVNFTCEYLDGQDGVSSRTSAFQRAVVKFAKTFLLLCVPESSLKLVARR